jgi:hypothetical protein
MREEVLQVMFADKSVSQYHVHTRIDANAWYMCVWENDDVVRHDDDDDDDGKHAQKSEGRSAAAHCWLAIHHQLFISKRVGIIYGGSAGELNTPESSVDVNIGKVRKVYNVWIRLRGCTFYVCESKWSKICMATHRHTKGIIIF